MVRPTPAPAGLAPFFFASGVVPLALASDFVRNVPPWPFGLLPGWSTEQLAFFLLVGTILGLTSSRPAIGLAGVAIGSLLGLAADLWWLTGFVRPEDQTFVSLLPQDEWRSRLAGAALALVGVVAVGFLVGAVVRWLVRDRSRPPRLRLRPTELAPIAAAVIGGPVLPLVIAMVAASSALVVPDGSQIQMVRFSAGQIVTDPAALRPGQARFLCLYAADAEPWGALLAALPEGAEPATLPATQDYDASCERSEGGVRWGSVAELRPGRYAWRQIDNSGETWRVVATSPVIVVTP